MSRLFNPVQMLIVWLIVLMMFAAAPLAAQDQDDDAAPPVVETSADQDAEIDLAEAASGPLAGHSNHGETFNEGPRQAAYLMGTTGDVHLEITTAYPEVQDFFDQGLGQLHGFWYFEAERSFRHAAAIDPNCAMLYWGMAMANFDNSRDRAQGFIEEAMERREQASQREQMWIEALDRFLDDDTGRDGRQRRFVRDLEAITYDYPDEIEAKAFLAWTLWHSSQRGTSLGSHVAVDALLKQVFDENPWHPAHHYAIHLWDYEKSDQALHAAAMCGPSAPGIAHMWHMPGHIYSRLHRYADAAWQQEASARTDHAQMMRDRLMPDQIFNFAHNNEWLVRNLMNVGRVHDAIDLAKNMIELPRHPSFNRLNGRGSARYGRTRLFDVLSGFQMWDELIALADTVYLEPTDLIAEQIKREKFLAIAHYQRGEAAQGNTHLANLRLWQAFDAHRSIDGAVDEVRGYQALAEGRPADAVDLFDDIRRFDRCTLAAAQFEAGDIDDALESLEREVRRSEGEVRPLATLAYYQFEAGRQEDAAETFEKLRDIASNVDLDTPLFARLAPLAASCGAEPDDWRLPREDPGDLGDRPDLSSLGPFRWQPMPAIDWSLPNGRGETISLSDYRGQPVIVIFYLGYGCLHCVEQLEIFAPMTERFNEAGIELIAISSDPQDMLKESVIAYADDPYEEETGPFPFPLVSDSRLDVFKRYRAYDDFEKMELHGTFLIDADGLVRWQDIGYEPFTEAEFLLEEAQRLLAQPAGRSDG